MIFQFSLTNASLTGSFALPFSGKCRVKLIKIDYLATVGTLQNAFCSINSNELFNNTPLSGALIFSNAVQNYYGDSFVFETMLPQLINITLIGPPVNANPGAYSGLLITLDIEEINKFI